MMYENKYLIFDNPKKKYKYILKRAVHILNTIRYRVAFCLFKPNKVKEKKFYVAICAIFKNEARYMREWIEFHKIIGVEHFYLYNNFSNDDYKNVLEPYIINGLVTLIEWPIKQGQMLAYKDCAEKYGDESNWIAYIDLDEYIVPNKSNNIKELLKKFENRPIVIAYWRLFGSSGKINRDTNGLVTEDFYLCWRKYTNVGKFFYNTSYDYADDLKINQNMHSHWAKYSGHKLPPVNFYGHIICNEVDVVDDEYPSVQINHYFTKSYNEYLEKKARGDAYFELNPRDEEYYDWHDMKCQSVDFNIRKYMVKLKQSLDIE